MIGFSGSGKTCFLYAMYHYMLNGSVGINITSTDHNANLDLAVGWSDISTGRYWPLGTNETRFYDFTMMYHQRSLATFKWCDYRGGILSERMEGNQEVPEFHQRILESDAIILCVGAETILDVYHKGESASDYQFQIFNFLITNYAIQQTKRIPISIVLTKSDLYSPEEEKISYEIIRNKLGPLFQIGANWEVTIIAARLGKELGHDHANKIIGIIEPYNVHLPVLCFLNVLINKKLREVEERLKDYNYDMQRWKNTELNWIQRAVRFLIDLFTSQEQMEQSEQVKYTRQSDEQLMHGLKQCSKQMVKQVASGSILYLNGIKIK